MTVTFHRRTTAVAAVLFDRDGTLVRDVPYNGDPRAVELMPGARAAVQSLRRAGVPIGVVSNQSGIARGLVTAEQVAAVNAEIIRRLGPFDTWHQCVHGPDDDCGCRKPRPGLIHSAAEALGVDPSQCVVIGDIGSDIEAAHAAGSRAILIPTPQTLPAETAAAPVLATDIGAAVSLVLEWSRADID